jgi:hypothetical protein
MSVFFVLSETCTRCHIPREYYNNKSEPGYANPDYSMPKGCQQGHLWGKKFIGKDQNKENSN